MGKSCIRFKNVEQIPYDLIGELVKKITVTIGFIFTTLWLKENLNSDHLCE